MKRWMAIPWLAGAGIAIAANLAIALGLALLRPGPAPSPATPPPLPAAIPLAAAPSPPRASAAAPAASARSLPAAALPALALPPLSPLPAVAWPAHMPIAESVLPGLPAVLPAEVAVGDQPTPAADGVRRPAELIGALQIERFYPRSARKQRIGGSSVLDLEIDAAGRVSGFRIVRSDPSGIFDEAAGRMVTSLTFHPASLDGRPMPSRLRQTIVWTPAP